jgi:hypothetical protein
VTEPPGLWSNTYLFLADLADERLTPAEYAKAVLKLYDVLVQYADDAADALQFLLFHLPSQRVSKQHRALAVKLLPNPPRRNSGRPKGAPGRKAYRKLRQLYTDWNWEKARRPLLTKEQFAKERLGITDQDLTGDYALDHRAKIDAILQELKPARIKRLAGGSATCSKPLFRLSLRPINTWLKNGKRQSGSPRR